MQGAIRRIIPAGARYRNTAGRLVHTTNHVGLNVRKGDSSAPVFIAAPKAREKPTLRVSPDGRMIAAVFGDACNDTLVHILAVRGGRCGRVAP